MSRMGVEPSIVCQESKFKFQLSIIVRNGDLILTMKVAQIVDFINPRYFLLKNKDLVMLVATDKGEQSPTATPRARLVGQSTGPSGKKGHLWTLPTGECFVMWMWVKMEDLGDHRCQPSLVLTIRLLGYLILTHTHV